ncbi:MAG: hypothetical protein MR278_01440 [Bacteroidales bacterium]|nr:hypothetical protein [Anaerotignum sp.]MCI5678639.1 hypothetical protein [Bacteroidales bacterium]MDY3926697.1 hypothetical protein [Anaerotignum sp.]
MSKEWNETVTNLLTVKSIVTVVLTVVFAYLSIKGRIDGGQFLNIFSIVIAFYFGTQHQKITEKTAEKGDNE